MLKKKYANTYNVSNNVINKFILLLQKGIYPYKYMDDWENIRETLIQEKENFYRLQIINRQKEFVRILK